MHCGAAGDCPLRRVRGTDKRPQQWYYRRMRAYLPIILVLLAVFAAACIIYIAWELSADAAKAPDATPDEVGSDDRSALP